MDFVIYLSQKLPFTQFAKSSDSMFVFSACVRNLNSLKMYHSPKIASFACLMAWTSFEKQIWLAWIYHLLTNIEQTWTKKKFAFVELSMSEIFNFFLCRLQNLKCYEIAFVKRRCDTVLMTSCFFVTSNEYTVGKMLPGKNWKICSINREQDVIKLD